MPTASTLRANAPRADALRDALQVCMAGCVFALLTMAILGSIGWLWVSRKFGKFAAWQAYNFINAMTNLAFFLPGAGDSWMVIIIAGVNGIPVGGQFLTNAVTSDVIDYDEFLNGVRSEGASRRRCCNKAAASHATHKSLTETQLCHWRWG